MRIKDELFGKEVLDADVQIVGKVTDVIFDKETFEITDIAIKKTACILLLIRECKLFFA